MIVMARPSRRHCVPRRRASPRGSRRPCRADRGANCSTVGPGDGAGGVTSGEAPLRQTHDPRKRAACGVTRVRLGCSRGRGHAEMRLRINYPIVVEVSAS